MKQSVLNGLRRAVKGQAVQTISNFEGDTISLNLTNGVSIQLMPNGMWDIGFHGKNERYFLKSENWGGIKGPVL